MIKTAEERIAVEGVYNHSDRVLNTVTVSFAKYHAMIEEAAELRAAYEAQRNEVERLKAENEKLKESNLELERLCDKTYVQQGADAYNHCCEVFEAWRVKRQKLDLPTHDWADGLYNSINWLQDTVEELETENEELENTVTKLNGWIKVWEHSKRNETLRETQTNEGSCSVACDQYPNCIYPKNGDSK